MEDYLTIRDDDPDFLRHLAEIEGASGNPKQNKGHLGDFGTDLKRGVQQIPGVVTGLADIVAAPFSTVTGIKRPFSRAADWAGQITGFQPDKWQQEARAEYSPDTQQAMREFDEAQGVSQAAQVLKRNPMYALHVATESVPSMIAGGGAGGWAARGLMTAEKLAATRAAAAAGNAAARAELMTLGTVGGAIGEGAITAGQHMSGLDYDVDPLRAAGTALGAGALTGLIGYAGGRAAGKLFGTSDIDTMIAGRVAGTNVPGGAPTSWLGTAGKVGRGALQEGLLEELPQSMQEQVWQNLATGAPWDEGVGKAGVLGAAAGMAMGGAANVSLPNRPTDLLNRPKAAPEDMAQPVSGPVHPADPQMELPLYGGSYNWRQGPQQGDPLAGLEPTDILRKQEADAAADRAAAAMQQLVFASNRFHSVTSPKAKAKWQAEIDRLSEIVGQNSIDSTIVIPERADAEAAATAAATPKTSMYPADTSTQGDMFAAAGIATPAGPMKMTEVPTHTQGAPADTATAAQGAPAATTGQPNISADLDERLNAIFNEVQQDLAAREAKASAQGKGPAAPDVAAVPGTASATDIRSAQEAEASSAFDDLLKAVQQDGKGKGKAATKNQTAPDGGGLDAITTSTSGKGRQANEGTRYDVSNPEDARKLALLIAAMRGGVRSLRKEYDAAARAGKSIDTLRSIARRMKAAVEMEQRLIQENPALARAFDNLHELVSRRDKAMAALADARAYKRDKNGTLRRMTAATNKNKKVYLADLDPDAAKAQFDPDEGVVGQALLALHNMQPQIMQAVEDIEALVGRANIQEAQRIDKKVSKTGQTTAATLFSAIYNEINNQDIDRTNPFPSASNKVLRDRNELEGMTTLKWYENATRGFQFGNQTYYGVDALLMKIRHHSHNPYHRALASRVYALLEDARRDGSLKDINIEFYAYDPDAKNPGFKATKNGRVKPTASGNSDTVDLSSPTTVRYGRFSAPNGEPHLIFGPDGQTPEIILHEITHMALFGFVEEYSDPKNAHTANGKLVQEFRGLMELVRDSMDTTSPRLKKIQEVLKTKPNAALHEFLAYGLYNDEFRRAMQKIQIPDKHPVAAIFKNAWNAFVELTRRFLGLPKSDRSAHMAFLTVTAKLLGTDAFYVPKSTTVLLDDNTKAGGGMNYTRGETRMQRLVNFWSDLANSRTKNLFRVEKMDNSAGRPNKSFTMEEIAAKHGLEALREFKADELASFYRASEGHPRIVRGWSIGSFENQSRILEDENGRVTVETPNLQSGKSNGWRAISAALAYSFYNGKVFIGEAPGIHMSNRAIVRYLEMMLSAALKYQSTDFMIPSPHMMGTNAATVLRKTNDQDAAFAEDNELGAIPWLDKNAKGTTPDARFEANVLQMLELSTKLVNTAFPEVADLRFSFSKGLFSAKDGTKVTEADLQQMVRDNKDKLAEWGMGLDADAKGAPWGRTAFLRAAINNTLLDATAAEATAFEGEAHLEEDALSGALYAETASSEDAATEAVTQKSMEQQAKDNKARYGKHAFTKGPLQRGFEAMGFTADTTHNFTLKAITALLRTIGIKEPAKYAERVVNFRTHLQDWAPRAARFMSYFDAGFNITQHMRDLIKDAKTIRGVPISVVNNFSRHLENMSYDESVAAFTYLDSKLEGEELAKLATSLKLSPKIVESANHLRKEFRSLIEQLAASVGAQEEAAMLRSLPMSESLLYVLDEELSTGKASGRSFGAHDLERLRGEVSSKGMRDNIKTHTTAWDGSYILGGDFYRYEIPGQTHDRLKYGYVHEKALDMVPEDIRNSLDKTHKYRMGKAKADGDSYVVDFIGRRTVESMLKAGRQEEVSAALMNTVNLMSNAVAATTTGRLLLEYGTKSDQDYPQVVYESEEAFRKVPGHGDVRLMKWGDSQEHTAATKHTYRHPNAWILLPDADAYGPLRGTVIRGPEWMALQDAYDRSNLLGFRFPAALMRVFKAAKTKWNPPTHVTNALTNVTLAYMHNLSFQTVKDAATLYKRYLLTPDKMTATEHAIMQEFIDSGAVLADFSANEMKAELYDAIERKVAGPGLLKPFLDNMLGAKAEVLDKLAKKGKNIDDAATTLYATEDNLFRLAAFMAKMGELTDKEDLTQDQRVKQAGRFAATAFLDYDIDSVAVKALRQSFLPFVSWTYAIVPVLARIATQQPWKLVQLGALYSAAGALLSAAAGGDDDDKTRKAERMDDRLILGLYGPYMNMRLPFLDSEGKKAYINVGKYIPNPFSFKEMPNGAFGIKHWPSSLQPSGPVMVFAAGVLGIDPFTGKKITKDTNTGFENFLEVGKQTALQMGPPLATTVSKMDVKGPTGEGKDPVNVSGAFTGHPVKRVDADEVRFSRKMEIKTIEREFATEESRLRSQMKRGNLTPEEMHQRIQELRQRRRDRIAEYR